MRAKAKMKHVNPVTGTVCLGSGELSLLAEIGPFTVDGMLIAGLRLKLHQHFPGMVENIKPLAELTFRLNDEEVLNLVAWGEEWLTMREHYRSHGKTRFIDRRRT